MNHGSNSWMMDSKRITANSRDANPTIHANANTTKTISDLDPAALRIDDDDDADAAVDGDFAAVAVDIFEAFETASRFFLSPSRILP